MGANVDRINIVATKSDHGIDAAFAIEDVDARVAGEDIGERIAGAVDIADTRERQVLDVGAEREVRRRAVDQIRADASLHHESVLTSTV